MAFEWPYYDTPSSRSNAEPLQPDPSIAAKEADLAKGQKKSNREVRKPKAEKPKPAVAAPSYLTPPSKKK